MKPGDFFLGGRQFFGFLIPGMLWVIDLFLFLSELRVDALVGRADRMGLAGWLSVLACAFVLGSLGQALFPLAWSIGDRLFARLQTESWPRIAGYS